MRVLGTRVRGHSSGSVRQASSTAHTSTAHANAVHNNTGHSSGTTAGQVAGTTGTGTGNWHHSTGTGTTGTGTTSTGTTGTGTTGTGTGTTGNGKWHHIAGTTGTGATGTGTTGTGTTGTTPTTVTGTGTTPTGTTGTGYTPTAYTPTGYVGNGYNGGGCGGGGCCGGGCGGGGCGGGESTGTNGGIAGTTPTVNGGQNYAANPQGITPNSKWASLNNPKLALHHRKALDLSNKQVGALENMEKSGVQHATRVLTYPQRKQLAEIIGLVPNSNDPANPAAPPAAEVPPGAGVAAGNGAGGTRCRSGGKRLKPKLHSFSFQVVYWGPFQRWPPFRIMTSRLSLPSKPEAPARLAVPSLGWRRASITPTTN